MPIHPSSFSRMEHVVPPVSMYHHQYSLGQQMTEPQSMEEAIAEYRMARMVFEARMQARASNVFQPKQQQRMEQIYVTVRPLRMTMGQASICPISNQPSLLLPPARDLSCLDSPMTNRPLVPTPPGLALWHRESATLISDDSSSGNKSEAISLDGSSGSKRVALTASPRQNKLYIDAIRDLDILCGRGGRTNHHPGNKRYRRVVSEMKSMYRNQGAKSNKTDLSRCIVNHVCRYGGRFIKKEEETGRYFVLSRGEARRKTSQALREAKALKWTE